jgi:hypothetical protein
VEVASNIVHGLIDRALRGIFHRLFSPQMLKSYAPIQQYEAKQLSYDLLNNPKDFYKHNRRYATSFVLNVTYGRRAPVCNDRLWLQLMLRGMSRHHRYLRLPHTIRTGPKTWKFYCRYLSLPRQESHLQRGLKLASSRRGNV